VLSVEGCVGWGVGYVCAVCCVVWVLQYTHTLSPSMRTGQRVVTARPDAASGWLPSAALNAFMCSSARRPAAPHRCFGVRGFFVLCLRTNCAALP
jgi:hypothetical protein